MSTGHTFLGASITIRILREGEGHILPKNITNFLDSAILDSKEDCRENPVTILYVKNNNFTHLHRLKSGAKKKSDTGRKLLLIKIHNFCPFFMTLGQKVTL